MPQDAEDPAGAYPRYPIRNGAKQLNLGTTGLGVSEIGLGCMVMSGMQGPADRTE